jgi:hypothetical protein
MPILTLAHHLVARNPGRSRRFSFEKMRELVVSKKSLKLCRIARSNLAPQRPRTLLSCKCFDFYMFYNLKKYWCLIWYSSSSSWSSANFQEYANSYTCTSSGRQEFRLFSTIFL